MPSVCEDVAEDVQKRRQFYKRLQACETFSELDSVNDEYYHKVADYGLLMKCFREGSQ